MAESSSSTKETQSSTPENSAFAAPQISLPKGGGAIRGIGEKFAANAVTGTGGLTIPIALSPGRSGFGPQLSLSYDSGSGNGPFGIGCGLSLPSITRKTDKGIPQYRDSDESDVFILSGSEDLVPVLREDCDKRWVPEEFEREGYRIKRYRPRIEGLFARIERWTCLEDGDVHWRSISKDNILTLYGTTRESRIYDPAAPDHVFSWLISQSYDDRGNGMVYEYAAEDQRGVDLTRTNEQHRVGTANRYLKRIKYGNRRPFLFRTTRQGCQRPKPLDSELRAAEWMFEAVLDYGEVQYREANPDADREIFVDAQVNAAPGSVWPMREDPFSTYRSGFEIRTYRLCRRVLMFHHFPDELGVTDYLVRATEFEYRQKGLGSFMTRVTQSGFKLQADGRYLKRSLPPVELDYTLSPLEQEDYDDYQVKEVDSESLENLPGGIDESGYRWIDLDGEGIAGVLSEQGNAWYYKPNLGSGRFGPTELVRTMPSVSGRRSGRQEFLDVAGDGNLDLVQFGQEPQGFFERTTDAEWGRFRPFQALPVQDWGSRNLRFADVTGDGVADVLITEGDALVWHPSLLAEGFGTRVRVPIPQDEEKGAQVLFADAMQSIYLGDMSGDGLSDIVRIRNGEICYWPNLGYGRFGAKVTMDNAPRFDEPDQFDQNRIRLADTDGSGMTDIIYLGRDGIRVYLNQSGNGWSTARVLSRFPATDNLTSISVVDFLGRGTACILWSSPLPTNTRRPLRYIDLMAGTKPHLLTRVRNNLGAETVIEYASSTEFYLADKTAGKPWITKLPFPVHVVKRIETYDHISRNRFVTSYRYRHGYFDAVEREFRGFGLVEQLDTEEFAIFSRSTKFPAGENAAEFSHVPPVLTRTWFHLGAFLKGRGITKQYAEEYYREGNSSLGESELSREQFGAMLLPDTVLPEAIGPEEMPEACRALKGSILRQEIYALDSTECEDRPYSASERNYSIQLLQARHGGRHGVFFVHPREQVDFNYERKLFPVVRGKIVGEGSPPSCPVEWRADPRVTHAFTLEVDDYGNVLLMAAVGYGRRFEDASAVLTSADREKQKEIHVTFTANGYTNAVLETGAYRVPLSSESRTFELLNIQPDACHRGITNLFRFAELRSKIRRAGDGAHEIPYEDYAGCGVKGCAPYRRLIEHLRTLYRRDDLTTLLPLGHLESMALPGESFKLAFTPGLLNQIFKRNSNDLLPNRVAVLGAEGGYRLGDDLLASKIFPDGSPGHWWIPSGRIFFSPSVGDSPSGELNFARWHFFLPHRFQDPFGNSSFPGYDAHSLVLRTTRDALDNTVMAETDYRALQPRLVIDPNRNRSEVAFDALGLVVGSAVMGKAGENKGDSLDDFRPDLTQAELDAFVADPKGRASNLLANATARIVYDLHRYSTTTSGLNVQPAVAASLARETHVSDLKPGEQSKVQVSLSYSDGFGREIQKRIQAEPGPVEVENADGVITTIDTSPKIRWVASGWTIFNNKGKPVREYEPFFSIDHQFQFARKAGVSPILFYDPVGRVIAKLRPNHTYEKVVFDPWSQVTWDVNDTVTMCPEQDKDVGPFLARLPGSEFFPTWYARRKDGAMGQREKDAALKAAAHAGTPSTGHFDTLGRLFLSLSHNRMTQDGSKVDESYATRTEFDIEGNQREVIDALDRVVMRYDYDLLRNRIHQSSMEAGQRWMLNDVTGKPVRAWDSRGQAFRTDYDALRRPVRAFVLGADKARPRHETLHQRTIYGEAQGDAHNHRARIFQAFDTAGLLTNVEFDFKGNLLHGTRQLACDYKQTPDWAAAPALEQEVLSSSTVFDALNRPLVITTPDGSITRPAYNEANLLERMSVNLHGVDTATPVVTNIDYNAKGQRVLIRYGMLDGHGQSKVRTDYTYDPETFRLTRLLTTRSAGTRLQDLNYSYDPVGNITSIRDDSQQTIFFNGQVVEPHNGYAYDAIYRLIAADGREHIGQAGQATPQTWDDKWTTGLPHPSDGQAMRRYRQDYHYDPAGNFIRMIHVASNGNWTRSYEYNETSLIEREKVSNRLSRTSIGNRHDRYSHDVHGNMIRMPHLGLAQERGGDNMSWDFGDRLQSVELPGGGRAFYVYDASGQRTRKVIERTVGVRREERIYLGGYEVFRSYAGDGANLVLERETLHVMDDKQRLALVETRTSGNDVSLPQLVRFQVANHLWSASLELNDGGEIISYEEYTPYGSTSYQAMRNQTEAPKRYRYTGKERDEESGFAYHSARYYMVWLGRWASVDPDMVADYAKSDKQPYSYVNSNPIIAIDPRGQFLWFVVLAVAAIALTPGIANAPEPGGPVYESPSDLEQAGRMALIIGSGGVGGLVSKSVAGAGYSLLVADATGGFYGGVTFGVGNRAISDISRGEASSPGTYLEAAGESGTVGFVFGGVIGGGRQAYSSLVSREVGAGLSSSATTEVRPVLSPAVTEGEAAAATANQSSDTATGFLFRGTSEGFPGSPGLQRVGVTPASEDPLVATVFGTESQAYGRGVVQIASPSDLEGVVIGEGNVLASIEREVAVELTPLQYAERAGIQITAAEARGILERAGYPLPAQIRGPAGVSQVLASTPRLSQAEIDAFVQEARLIAGNR